MANILVQHTVRDYTKWKKEFDSAFSMRKSFGEVSVQVYRDASDPNKLTIMNTWDSMANAQKFVNSPELRAAMEKAGVEGMPVVTFLTEA
jgi:quinol monooxygenase YgiN